MPTKLKRACRYRQCPALTDNPTGYCDQHRKQIARDYDRQRGTAAQRGYDSKWRQESKAYLKQHPMCVYCGGQATMVDHVTAHKGDIALFWDRSNWAPSCVPCNSRKAAREEGRWGK